MMVDAKKFGDEYVLALSRALAVRAKRRSQYCDIFLSDPLEAHVWMLHHKVKRALFLMQTKRETDYEKMFDCLADIMNYAVFAIAVLDKPAKHICNIGAIHGQT